MYNNTYNKQQLTLLLLLLFLISMTIIYIYNIQYTRIYWKYRQLYDIWVSKNGGYLNLWQVE